MRRQQPLFGRIDLTESADGFELRGHQGKWLFIAPLALAQLRDRSLAGRVAGQVITAQPFDSQDISMVEEPRGALNSCLPRFNVVRDLQAGNGAAARTRVGLGMEAPVMGVLILAAT